jgi:hypothetical protein
MYFCSVGVLFYINYNIVSMFSCFSKNVDDDDDNSNINIKRRKSSVIQQRHLHMELVRSINAGEKKLCYLKYLIDKDYKFSNDDINEIKKLNNKTNYFFLEDADNNMNIGKELISNHQYINNLLPTYIIFRNKGHNKRKWKRVTKKIIRSDLTSRNSIKFFKDMDEFNDNMDKYIYTNDFQRENIKVSIYGDNIVHKSIYKKLRVKYDFYYVNIADYEAVQTKITFLKNKQLLELLGAEHIIIDRHNLSSSINSHIVGITNYSIENSVSNNEEHKDSEKKMDVYKYRLRKGFYSTVADFMKKVDDDKYILLSREEIDMDFELKSLIGARIEKSLQEFNKVIRVSKVTNKEIQLEMLIQKGYGFSFSKKKNTKTINFLKIKAIFYGVDMLYCIDEIPLTYDGFKILNDMTNGEKRKYINNFYVRILRKNNFLSKHLAQMEHSNEPVDNVPNYITLSKNINSYFNIEQLLEYLKDSNDMRLNEEGFNLLRMCTINNSREEYNESKKTFLKRIIKLNNISWVQFEEYIRRIKLISIDVLIDKKIKSYDKMRKYILEFLGNVSYCSHDERGFYFIFNGNMFKDIAVKKKILILYTTQYLDTHSRKFNNEKSVAIIDFISNMTNEKINIVYELDYFSYKHLILFIGSINDDDDDDVMRNYTTPIQPNTTPLMYDGIVPLQETPELNYRMDTKTKELLCIVGL